jgi:hypothetical protein
MPTRKVPPNSTSLTGQVAGRKSVGSADSESTLEHDLLTLLEFDSAVDRYEVQPVRIDYVDENGRARHYTPDVLVHYRNRSDEDPRAPLLAEVKPRAVLARDWKDIRRKVRAARAYARENGWHFRVLTEKHIRTPYLRNARFLLPYTRLESDAAMEALLTQRLSELGAATPDALLASVYWAPENRAMLLPSVWRLVGIGRIDCDLGLPLTMATRLWLAE